MSLTKTSLEKLGGPIFSVSELDALAKSTGTHNFFGYYDVCAIEMALQGKGYDLRWFDSRKPIEELDMSPVDVAGVLVNITQTTLFFFTTRHWLGVRKIMTDDALSYSLYWMDSKDKRATRLDDDRVRAQIDLLRASRSAQVIYIVKKPLTDDMEDHELEHTP
jgi:hypothetical protein